MPKAFPCGSKLCLIYDHNEIRAFAQAASYPQAKFSLSNQGGFGSKAIGPRSNMVIDFIKNPNFTFQHSSFSDWSKLYPPTFGTSSFDPASGLDYIEKIMAEEIFRRIIKPDASTTPFYYKSIANSHSTILRGAYDGIYFGTPVTILQKITHLLKTHLLKLTLTSKSQSPNIYYDPNFIFSESNSSTMACWVIEVTENFNIMDPTTNQTWPMEYSIKAVLPTSLDPKASSADGFQLIEMTVSGDEKYLNAFDCFLCNNNDWNEELFSLSQLLEPLDSHMSPSSSTKSSSQAAANAMLKLKTKLHEETPSTPFFPSEIAALKQPGHLHDIVWNLGFLIAIKTPELYRALNIGRKFDSLPPPTSSAAFSGADSSSDAFSSTGSASAASRGASTNTPSLMAQRLQETRSYNDMAALNANFAGDYGPHSRFNRLELTQNCGYGLSEPPSPSGSVSQALALDYANGLIKFHGRSYQTPSDPTTAIGVPIILQGLEQRAAEVIPGEQKAVTDASSSSKSDAAASSIPRFHLEILKRTYNSEVGLTPNSVLSNAIRLFNNKYEIRQHATERNLYYNPYQKCFNPNLTTPQIQNWILITETTVKFVDSTSRTCFKKEFSYRTEAVLSIKETSCPVDLSRETELDNHINTHYKDGFILRKIEIKGPCDYRHLFDSFINRDRTKCLDFRLFMARNLDAYITNSQSFSDAKLSWQWPSPAEFQQIGTQDRIRYRNNRQALALRLAAARKLHLLLTTDSSEIKFTRDEETALCAGELGKITRKLCFVIGLREPRLYQNLDGLHQNPLIR